MNQSDFKFSKTNDLSCALFSINLVFRSFFLSAYKFNRFLSLSTSLPPLSSTPHFLSLLLLQASMVVANFEASQGESVLFVSPASVNQDALAKAKNATGDQVGSSGKTAFEAMERVAEGKKKYYTYLRIPRIKIKS